MPSEQPFQKRVFADFDAYRIREAGSRVALSSIEITYDNGTDPSDTVTLSRTPWLSEYRSVTDGTTTHTGTDLPANSFVCFVIESHYGSRSGIFGGTELSPFNSVTNLFPSGWAAAYPGGEPGLMGRSRDLFMQIRCAVGAAVVRMVGFYSSGMYAVADGATDDAVRIPRPKSNMCVRWAVDDEVFGWVESDDKVFGFSGVRGFDLKVPAASRPRLDTLASIWVGIDDTYYNANKKIAPTGLKVGYQSLILECDSTTDIIPEMESLEWGPQSGNIVFAVPDGTHVQMSSPYPVGLFEGDEVDPPAIPAGSGDTLPVITENEPDRAIDSSLWSYTITASNTPTVWGLSGGPAWMSIAGNVVSGTPDFSIFPAAYRFTVYAGNSAGIASLELIMTVTPSGFSLFFVGGPVTGSGDAGVNIGCTATNGTASLTVTCS